MPTDHSKPGSGSESGPGDLTIDFVQSLANDTFDEAAELLAPEYRDDFVDSLPGSASMFVKPDPAAVLEEYWQSLESLYGSYRSIADQTVEDTGRISLTLDCADGAQPMALSVDDGAITDISIPAEYTPPAYAEPESITEHDVEVVDDPVLEGTVTVPDHESPVPGVVLVPGGGSYDRDFQIGPNAFLKDLALGLATEGIAVLRYDKRTAEYDLPPADRDIDTVIVDDAVAACQRLAAVDSVKEDCIFVCGHSIGGLGGPRIAASHGNLAGVGILDGMGLPFVDAYVQSFEEMFRMDGSLTDEQRATLDAMKEAQERLTTEDIDPEETVLGSPGAWWKSLTDYDQVAAAKALDCPIFVAHSGREAPETKQASIQRWRTEIPSSRGTFELYEAANHYFQAGRDTSTIAEPFLYRKPPLESLVVDLAEWIGSQPSTAVKY